MPMDETESNDTPATADAVTLGVPISGSLYYDTDGNDGGFATMLIATLGTTTHPLITASDFSHA